MRKLINMVSFIEEIGETSTIDTDQGDWYYLEVDKLDKIRRYANFLKQPLELWMFVPCKLVDGVWAVFEEPKKEEPIFINKPVLFNALSKEYQEAKECCLFEGCTIELNKSNNYYVVKVNDDLIWTTWNKSKTIEDLIIQEITLTPTALNQLGL